MVSGCSLPAFCPLDGEGRGGLPSGRSGAVSRPTPTPPPPRAIPVPNCTFPCPGYAPPRQPSHTFPTSQQCTPLVSAPRRPIPLSPSPAVRCLAGYAPTPASSAVLYPSSGERTQSPIRVPRSCLHLYCSRGRMWSPLSGLQASACRVGSRPPYSSLSAPRRSTTLSLPLPVGWGIRARPSRAPPTAPLEPSG